MAAPKDVDEYIAAAPAEAQSKLKQIRQIIQKVAPEAQEKLSYGMPYYNLNGRFLYLAHFKDHVSLFAMPTALEKFGKELAKYHRSKATIGFPLNEPLPGDLIRRIVEFRAAEQRAKKH